MTNCSNFPVNKGFPGNMELSMLKINILENWDVWCGGLNSKINKTLVYIPCMIPTSLAWEEIVNEISPLWLVNKQLTYSESQRYYLEWVWPSQEGLKKRNWDVSGKRDFPADLGEARHNEFNSHNPKKLNSSNNQWA